ncbi:ribosome maturation factor RimM [Methyloligella solikamskensis]|uniref:Ribosome maturation factor RimM n=1 Tax=Methyloligella solikamskensis TaxID=1177756 RepID=A0ABW3J696_9HYPH
MAAGEKADDRLLLGEIGAAHGLKGELRLRSYTENPAAIADYGKLQTEAGDRTFKIAHLREGPKGLIAKFKGVNGRNEAEALTGTKLYVDRDRLPESEPDEWYYADLVGLTAIDGEGAELGVVTAVHNFGASDIIELQPESGQTILVPFTEEAVPNVDIEAGRLTIHLPEGLIDEPGEDEPAEDEPTRNAPSREEE